MNDPSERWQRIARWFDELAELDATARAARLAAIAGEDAAAAAEVAALLDADAQEHGLLESDALDAIPTLIASA